LLLLYLLYLSIVQYSWEKVERQNAEVDTEGNLSTWQEISFTLNSIPLMSFKLSYFLFYLLTRIQNSRLTATVVLLQASARSN